MKKIVRDTHTFLRDLEFKHLSKDSSIKLYQELKNLDEVSEKGKEAIACLPDVD